ncbi:MAG: hypothetical protein QM483_11485 [Desulfuromusa sp.]
MKNKLWILLLFLLAPLFFGCQATTTYYQGAKADSQGVVRLAVDQVENQRWQDLYVTVDYSYDRQGDQFNIDGLFSFSFSPKINFERVRDLKLKLFLLDKDMFVVDYLEIARTLSTSLEDQISFSYKLDLAENVVAFTFGYEGSFIDDEGSGFTIWKLPKRNL